MTAYPHHTHQKMLYIFGNFVEAVTGLSNQYQDRRRGAKDFGWKRKSRNSQDDIKSLEDLTATLTYLLEEQYIILATFYGDLESVRLSTSTDEEMATQLASKSSYFCVGRDTLHSYTNLLNHLARVQNTRWWGLSLLQLKNHADNVRLIRGKYRYLIKMVCRFYICLNER